MLQTIEKKHRAEVHGCSMLSEERQKVVCKEL
jgi:hypothetical protein